MANRERNKRSARKARAEERAALEAVKAETQPSKKPAKAEKPQPKKADKNRNPNMFQRLGIYFKEVRTEILRVTWPSKTELRNYSIAVISMLIIFGLVIWLVDSGIVAGLIGYTGLRG